MSTVLTVFFDTVTVFTSSYPLAQVSLLYSTRVGGLATPKLILIVDDGPRSANASTILPGNRLIKYQKPTPNTLQHSLHSHITPEPERLGTAPAQAHQGG